MGQDTNSSVAPLCTKIWFDYQSGVVNYRDGQSLYRTKLDGSTYILIDGMEFPVSGCPVPEKVLWANVQYFFVRNSKIIIPIIFGVICLVLLQWFLWLIPNDQLTDLKLNFVALFSFWMNLALLAAFIAPFFILLAKEVFLAILEFRSLIMPDTSEFNFDLGKDIFIYSEENETNEQFKARVLEAQKNITHGVWVVVIAFRNPGGVVITKGENEKILYSSDSFLREKPPYETANFSGEIERKGFRFSEETFSEYRNYLSRFAFYFPEYAKARKVELKMSDPLEQYLETI